MTKPNNKTEPQLNEIIVVTGTSTGIGNATAKELANRGFYVLAMLQLNKCTLRGIAPF